MRIVAIGLWAFALFVSACGPSNTSDAVTDGYDNGQTDATASVVASTVVVAADNTTQTSSDLDTAGLSCDNERFLDGDFDGDGTADRTYYDESRSSVVVCSAFGNHVLRVGLLEILAVSDVDGDGRDEILAGATTAWGEGLELVALVDGRLDFVLDPSGEPLSLWRGLPPGRVLASGCGSFTTAGGREVALVEGTVDETGALRWQRTVFRIDGHQAIEVLADQGSLEVSGSPDPLADPAVQELVGEPC